jgi:hypothetical protein
MAQPKQVAILEPIGSADKYIKNIVLEEVYSVSKTYGDISIIDRQTVKRVLEEKKFQLDLLTEDSKICEICKTMNAGYVLVITVSDVGKNNHSISCKVIDVNTAITVQLNFIKTKKALSDLVSCTQKVVGEVLDSMKEEKKISEEETKPVKQKEKIFLTLSDTVLYFNSYGGDLILDIMTNASSWESSKEISWCPMERYDSSLFLTCKRNLSVQERSEKITITADNKIKTVRIVQKGITYLEKGDWRKAISKMMSSGTTTYDNGLYKGEKSKKGSKTGLGVYFFNTEDESYWGSFLQGESSGRGMYIIAKEGDAYFFECWRCKYYAGSWSYDMKNGLGKCYDNKGKLLYFGNFQNDAPVESFPQSHNDTYKFECIEYDNGDIYLGETYKTLKDGLGIFFKANGDVWYGEWKNGKRNGSGIEYERSGAIKTGNWYGDKFFE